MLRYLKGTDLLVDTMIELLSLSCEWIARIVDRTTERHCNFEKKLCWKIAKAVLNDLIVFGERLELPLWRRHLSFL
ncbi:hypothetical protein V3564_04505 [Bartonella sp. B12(2025)]